MKVRCITPDATVLSLGIVYKVLVDDDPYYTLDIEDYKSVKFFKDRFEIVKETEVSADQLQKKDAGKSDPMMVEEDLAFALQGVNAVLDYGKAKYGTRGGWKQVDIERYRSAQARHRRGVMIDGLLGKDDESGLLHQMHEACNSLFILQNTLAKMTPAQRAKALTFITPEPVNK